MLLDPAPKTKREELYGRDRELWQLSLIDRGAGPLVLVSGIRRIGKTSLVKVFLGERGDDHVFVDGSTARRWTDLANALLEKGLVEDSGVGGSDSSLFERVVEMARRRRGKRFLLVVDEAHEMSRSGLRLLEEIAKAVVYEGGGVHLVLVSSAPGLLMDYLGVDKPGRALRTTHFYEVRLGPLPRDAATELLRDGLRELGVSLPDTVIEKAVDFFGAIPGWLVFFGRLVAEGASPETAYRLAVDEALEEIRRLAPRSQLLLHVIAKGYDYWKAAKQALEELEGKPISNNGFRKAVLHLERRLIIMKKRMGEYVITDPVYARAALKLKPEEVLSLLSRRRRGAGGVGGSSRAHNS
ncbi:ATP-binding protein [Pyrofollis japonicus]|uniref:AAA family ATPase n=1 Tax=Pyrofollis japonicus TaxID=3060460 RepID=UPI00295C2BE2|nr:ATP-binding protein [Pyrofollis japonicus]BEP16844.1 ATP-binding protein [Pyrofollis japonicus]